ncbi:hypothetical protein SLA2020_492370 [Shorea laevis]
MFRVWSNIFPLPYSRATSFLDLVALAHPPVLFLLSGLRLSTLYCTPEFEVIEPLNYLNQAWDSHKLID